MTQRPEPTSPRPPDGGAAPAHHPGDLRQALLASLGLPADATPEAVDAAHDRVASYLSSAPPELQGWATQQAASADAAHAVLTGKAGDVLSRTQRPAATGSGAAVATGRPARPLALRVLTNPLVLVALVAAILVGVYRLGDDGSTDQAKGQQPAVAMSAQGADPHGGSVPAADSGPTPLDQAKVKELEAKVEADGKDVQSMASLGDMYFAAEDYARSASWRERIVAVRPQDTDALLATGVAYFNAGDAAKAEQRWTKATEIDPQKAEAYYDLGFLHVTKNPPDTAKAKQMWDKVVELEPGGPLAQKVQNHMNALVTPAPGPVSASPSPSK